MGKCFSSHSPRDGGGCRRQASAKKRRRRRASSEAAGADASDTAPQERLYRRYADPDAGGIRDAGVSALCSELGLDPEDIRALLLAWACDAREMCRFTRDQFLAGCLRLRAASAAQLRAGLDARLAKLLADTDEAEFRELYRWTFDFGLEAGQRSLTVAMACDLWGLVFAARASGRPRLLAPWLRWLPAASHAAKVVTRDTWLMFLAFCDAYDADLAAYDQNEAWPSLIDEFVEAETDRANQNFSS